VHAAGYLEQYIEDSPYSAFQTVWYSEKPDAIAGKLMEGRVAIAVDGTTLRAVGSDAVYRELSNR
jgi:spore germination protein KA